MKTFDVAGTSKHNGVVKARFANGLATRIKMLTKAGHTEINLVELPSKMTKEAASQYLVTQLATQYAEGTPEHAALTNKLNSISTKSRRAEKRAAVTGKPKAAAKAPAKKAPAKKAPAKKAPAKKAPAKSAAAQA